MDDIDTVFAEIDKLSPYSKFLSENTLSNISEYIDTGSYTLNAIISGDPHGGVPKGRVTLFAGESGTGKSLFVQKIIANAQKKGLRAIMFDSENAIDKESAERLGIKTNEVKHVSVITIEETKNIIFNTLTKISENPNLHGKFIIIIDSLTNLQSQLELNRMEKESTSADMGSRAKSLKSLLQTCCNMGARTQTTIVCTNWVYDDPSSLFPSIEKNMSGGKGPLYIPTVTVQLTRKPEKPDEGKTNDSTLAAGQKKYSGVKLVGLTRKNRLIKQYLEAEMFLSFDKGLDRYYGLLDLCVSLRVIVQSGATYSLVDGTKLGYYKNFRKDTELWENIIIPQFATAIKSAWAYSSEQDSDEELSEITEDEPE